MKKYLKIIVIVLSVLFLLITILFFFSKFYYKRSLQATLAEIYLKLTIKHYNGEELEQWLAEKKAEPEKIYEIPKNLKITGGIEVKSFKEMPVLYMNQEGKGKTIIYLHGGSYLHDPDPHHFSFLEKLIKKTDAKVIFPVYPKAPKHDFLESYHLITSLYEELQENVILMGDSAGGGFAFGLAMYFNEKGLRAPKGIITLSPWIDLTMENPEIELYRKVDPWLRKVPGNPIANSWANGADLRDYRLSPIFGDMKQLPPSLIFVGTREILYPDIAILAQKLKDANSSCELIIKEGMNHVYPLFPIPEADEAIDKITEELNHLN